MPKVPSCFTCNRVKADLERQFTALLPFGSDHEAATTTLINDGSRRLNKNPALRRKLQQGQRKVTVPFTGQLVSTLALPFEGEDFLRLCEFIVKGLVWHCWKHIIPRQYIVEVRFPTNIGQVFFADLLQNYPQNIRTQSFANGAFEYRCTRYNQDMSFTVWRLRFYGDLTLAGVDPQGQPVPLQIWAITGPPEINQILNQL
ncbi:hypothetical protein [Nitrospira sp.]|uniref:hypothetical protein n=1 Tax=Nitrospira sp. TaxID=70125 RepID=UPI003FCE7BF1